MKIYVDRDDGLVYIYSKRKGILDRWTIDISKEELKEWDKIEHDYWDLQSKLEELIKETK